MFFLYLYFLSLDSFAGVPTKRPKPAVQGRMLYEQHCWQCHGSVGKGDGPLSSLLESPSLSLRGEVLDNKKSAVRIVLKGKDKMPAFDEIMNRHDANRIFVFLGSLDKNADSSASDGQ